MNTHDSIRPFRVEIPQADLDDLADRLARTRLPRPAPGDDWDYGTPNHYLREMVDALAHGVRLARAGGADQRLPALPHRDRRPDDPLPARAVRRPRGARRCCSPTPTPARSLDFLDMIGPLTDPVAHGGRAEDAFSSSSRRCRASASARRWSTGGWTMARVARTYDTLMRRLGYDRYGIARQRRRRDGRPRARRCSTRPASSARTCCSCSRSRPATRPSSRSSSPRTTRAWSTCSGSSPSAATTRSTPPARRPWPSASPTPRSGQLAWNELFNSFGNGTSLVTPRPDPHPGHPVLVHQHLGHGGPLPLRGGAQRARSRRSARRRTGVAVFADDFQTIRAFAERDNTNIVHWSRLRARRPLRRHGGPRRARRRHPGLLRLTPKC